MSPHCLASLRSQATGELEVPLCFHNRLRMSGDPDLLFTVRNHFYLGGFQHAISEASDLEGLSESERVERDFFVYRSYIELGSYEVEKI
jgi:Coatomer epsilon subunit